MRTRPLIYAALVLIAATAWGDRRAELEAQVYQILKLDNVEMRRQVGPLFELADLYLEQNEADSALRLYELALRVDSLNYACQVKHAQLLLKKGQRDQAIEKLNLSSAYAEEIGVIEQARSILASEGAAPEPAARADHSADPVLYIVPLGNPNPVVLEEIAAELAALLDLNVIIMAKLDLDMGPFDRTQADSIVRGIADKIKENTPPEEFQKLLRRFSITSIENAGYPELKTFVKAYFREIGPAEDYETFCRQLDDFEKRGQYDISRLFDLISKRCRHLPGNIGYLYVTEADLYANDANYLFGSAMPRLGVISYHRFTGAFSQTSQNRPKLIKRTLKQAVSSTFFMMGIRRCSTPMCMRAYSHSLDEHDAKNDTLCTWCTQQIDALRAGLDSM